MTTGLSRMYGLSNEAAKLARGQLASGRVDTERTARGRAVAVNIARVHTAGQVKSSMRESMIPLCADLKMAIAAAKRIQTMQEQKIELVNNQLGEFNNQRSAAAEYVDAYDALAKAQEQIAQSSPFLSSNSDRTITLDGEELVIQCEQFSTHGVLRAKDGVHAVKSGAGAGAGAGTDAEVAKARIISDVKLKIDTLDNAKFALSRDQNAVEQIAGKITKLAEGLASMQEAMGRYQDQGVDLSEIEKSLTEVNPLELSAQIAQSQRELLVAAQLTGQAQRAETEAMNTVISAMG